MISRRNFHELDDEIKKKYYQFFEMDYGVAGGKISGKFNWNYINGQPMFRGDYKDGMKEGLFMFFSENGDGVAGEYSNDKLVRTITGKLEEEAVAA